ncbi:hypothetical protein LA76x_0790 [Lysobacter antibioticus]|uniref:Uncharacterized protein n=1 Tax=Lysobacter antibioticus TaxID=84531 RepID=A0A0S2F5X9_LYSAN|nr:hypothetical protein LA76x_0790 [Lysobacter antibioticus]
MRRLGKRYDGAEAPSLPILSGQLSGCPCPRFRRSVARRDYRRNRPPPQSRRGPAAAGIQWRCATAVHERRCEA